MSAAELSNVAYKKGNWMRYALWALAAICIIALTIAFVNVMNEAASSYSVDNTEKILSPEKSPSEGSGT